MAYSDTSDGCIDFMIPKDAQQAVKDAWAFAKTDMLNNAVDGSKDWDYGKCGAGAASGHCSTQK